MKILGDKKSNVLNGTTGADQIWGYGGNDTILVNGGNFYHPKSLDRVDGGSGNDTILELWIDIDSLKTSPSYKSVINGGSGYDTAVMVVTSDSNTSFVFNTATAKTIMSFKNTEELCFSFSNSIFLGKAMSITGSSGNETFSVTHSAKIDGKGGNDYIFAHTGENTLKGGTGNDFLGGAANNILSGGSGKDCFWFDTQYSNYTQEITDFKKGTDKIAIGSQAGEAVGADYGLSVDIGRMTDVKDFHVSKADFNARIDYDKSTGALTIDGFLVGNIDGKPSLSYHDFLFL